MPLSIDHGPFVICISVSNFSHFQHLHQNRIHDGCHLQLLSAPELLVGWSLNLVEGIGAAWRFRISKMVLF